MSIRDVLGARERAGEEAAEDGPLFAPGKCHSRQSNRAGVHAIHVKDDEGEISTGVYMQLATAQGTAAADGSWFRLTFLSDRKLVVTVRGRDLLWLFDNIYRTRIEWLQPLDAGPVRSVTVEAVEE